MKNIYFTRFMPTCERGGGSRRMIQMWETLKRLKSECHVVSTQRKDFLSMEALKRIEKNIPMDNKYRLWSEKRRKSVYRLSEISREWTRSIREIPRLELAVLDDPIYFAPLAEKLANYGIPVIAVCHNIESLVPSNVDPSHRMNLFKSELDMFARCRMVITISREDTILLNSFNQGNNAVFFPYYPMENIRERLLAVRKKREAGENGKKIEGKKKENFLMMGSAINNETREGMYRVIRHWETVGAARLGGKLLVAGYNSDTFLKDVKNSDNVEFLGSLDNDEHDKRLSEVAACICYQESGSGALTRICEMLIAGVPVLANSHAARSYYNRKGVIEFLDLNDLERALDQVDELGGQIPIPQGPDSSHLVSEIKKIMEQHISSQPLTKSF